MRTLLSRPSIRGQLSSTTPISVRRMATLEVLAQRFADFSRHCTPRAPLYAHLSLAASHDPSAQQLLQHAPEEQQIPVLFFAAVHHLLLSGLGAELASHYPNLSAHRPDGDPAPAFHAFVRDHSEQIAELVRSRSTQTNEVGRCAQFLPPFGILEREVGALAHVDVGTSAGLNLLLPRYQYHFEPGGVVGGQSAVSIVCATKGSVPVPQAMPRIVNSVGLDASPISVLDDDEVRWLEACVWPDQADRFARLVAAIELARQAPPDVRKGDAVDSLDGLIDEGSAFGHPVVTNSWVLNYLSSARRADYVTELDRIGSSVDFSWVIAESPAAAPGLPVPTTDPPEDITVITLVRWRNGVRSIERLGTSHPHGYWVRWESAIR